ncbi:MAG TPA: hypothetical protein VHB21_10445 [Minicystis sp.]|nr:hypothetical protein [Minicystis sp.]
MGPLDDLLDDLAERIAERLAARAAGGPPSPKYADAKSNPLGSARAFLDAGRRGDFPTFKRARNVVALWSDVEAYIERRRRERPRVVEEQDDRALLEAAGVRLRRPA